MLGNLNIPSFDLLLVTNRTTVGQLLEGKACFSC